MGRGCVSLVNSKVNEYIEEICSYVKFRKAHKEIKTEFLSHIKEKTEDLMLKGMNEEEASKKALTEMGQAEIIGKQLNQSHKSAPEWSILIITIVLSLLGLVVAYLLITYGINIDAAGFKKSTVFTIIGFAIIAGLYFFDYKKMEKYSGKIFIGVSLLLLLQLLTAVPINGLKAWISLGLLSFNVTELSLFLYVISLPKLLRSIELKSVKGYLSLSSMLLIPILLFIELKVFMAAVTYFIIFAMLMIKFKVKITYILSVIGVFIAGCFYMVISEPYRIKRVLIFINPQSDPKGSGWMNIQIQNLLATSGLMGNGFNFPKSTIPVVESDFVLTYIIYTFGWITAVILIIFILAFIIRIFNAAKVVMDVYGSCIIQGFMCIFAMKFIWNILMVFGLAPIISVTLPFISYGGSSLLMQMAAIGLIMSIYRCKSIILYS